VEKRSTIKIRKGIPVANLGDFTILTGTAATIGKGGAEDLTMHPAAILVPVLTVSPSRIHARVPSRHYFQCYTILLPVVEARTYIKRTYSLFLIVLLI
jgi:hypothetical protein